MTKGKNMHVENFSPMSGEVLLQNCPKTLRKRMRT